MNVKEYIASGKLESYALGLLSAEEQREVEQAAQQYPAIRQALREHERTLGQFSQAYAVQPPPQLRDQILDTAAGPATPPQSSPKSPARSPKPWAIAATILFLISGGLNVFQFQQRQQAHQDLTQAQMRLAEIQQEQQALVARYEQSQDYLAVLTHPATQRFPLEPVKGRPKSYRAQVYWNTQSHLAYMDLSGLPAPPTQKDYQLWALKDGKPIDMGVIKIDPSSTRPLLPAGTVKAADAFAITIEPAGGSATPTLSQLLVMGRPVQPA